MPSVVIDLDIIAENTRRVVDSLGGQVGVFGVTKAVCGSPLVARAMLRGGAAGLADSRLDNVQRLRNSGIAAPVMMLRIPSVSEAPDVVRLCDMSLNSEAAVLDALARAAEEQGVVHDVILMLEMGDRREGVPPEDLFPLAATAMREPSLRLAGIGANFMCASGVMPTRAKLDNLCNLADQLEQRFGTKLDYISGGNSANLALMQTEPLPKGVNMLRVGATILRGENSFTGGTLPGYDDGGFTLEAELVEIKMKHSLPDGETGPDAFGNRLVFEDRGARLRGIVNLGRVDMRPEGLKPRHRNVEIVTASSDHLIVDITEAKKFAVGDPIRFEMDYGALVQAMLSPYIDKQLAGRENIAPRPTAVRLIAAPDIHDRTETRAFVAGVIELGLEIKRDGVPDAADLPVWIIPDRDRIFEMLDTADDAAVESGLLWMDSEPGDVRRMANPEAAAVFAIRTATKEQARTIDERKILALTMEDIDLVGIRESARKAIQRVTQTTDGFALVLHASVARGMGDDPREAGLSYRECSTVMERIAASRELRAIVLSGIGESPTPPALDAAFGYLLSALGKRILSGRTE
ncbi:alanine racemase [Arvimicrobium flavum]|uniref:alanine racemase n=1 Tax=Arvimicrobium flavum TaxID=3393320 RepID=UPI00237B023F|nr:alanine racemase [Mesorhizobium shangrilense]